MTISIDCVFPSRSRLGEGAIWDVDDARLWWVDIRAGLVHRYDPASGRNDSFEIGEQVGSIARCASGGLVMATESGFYLFDPASGEKQCIATPESHLEGNRFNDGTTDRMAASGRELCAMMVRRQNAAAASTGLIPITASAVIWTLSTRPTAWLSRRTGT